MKKLLEITLGIVTSVGGFLEIGSITTAAQAGASFRYQLIWSVVVGTICIAFLVEMSGRFAAVSRRTIPDAMRERFGARFYAVVLIVMFGITLLVLAAELGGAAVALEMATAKRFSIWALPVAFIAWYVLWRAPFGVIEKGVSLLGLVTVAFLTGAIHMHPEWTSVAKGLVPTPPHDDKAKYWFIMVSVLGASVSPYLYYFYSSGAVEEKWDVSYIVTNRIVAAFGMGFGGILSVAVVILAAKIYYPRHIEIEHYTQLRLLLESPYGRIGFWLFLASLGIACFGATLEIALALAYLVAQGLGWTWGEDLEPHEDARFSLTYTAIIILAAIPILAGADPLKLTTLSMALTAAALPLATFPFLILMNDANYLGEYTNDTIGNTAVVLISALAMVLGVVSIPLQVVGG